MPRFHNTTKSKAPTNKEKVQEILKCSDPLYFINSYCKIAHPLKGLVPFKTFLYQDECVKAIKNNRFVIVNKSRQLGLSTVSSGYSLWLALFHKEKNIVVVANKLAVAQNFMKKVFTALDNLPPWLIMPKIVRRTLTELRFSNGSQIKAIATTGDAARSESISLIIIDECAHIEGIEELWLGVSPTISTGGSALLISSPSGVGTLFHKLWVGAQEGENGFVPIELPWTVHPERDEAWFKKESAITRAAKGDRGVAMEYLCSFIGSGDTFVKQEVMDELEKMVCNPIGKHPEHPEVWIWKYAEGDHRYVISADVARGDAGDYSTCHVIDVDNDEVVCEYKGKIPPDKFAHLLIDLGEKYNEAMICPENNGPGLVTVLELKKNNYPNLYYQKVHKNLYDAYLNTDISENELPGTTTLQKNREEMLTKLENALRNVSIKIYSKRFLEELKTFVWKNNKPQAMSGYNDDLILSLGIAMNLFEVASKKQYNADDLSKNLLLGISVDVRRTNSGGNPWGIAYTENEALYPTLSSQDSLFSPGHPNGANNNNPRPNHQNFNNPFWQQWGWMIDRPKPKKNT